MHLPAGQVTAGRTPVTGAGDPRVNDDRGVRALLSRGRLAVLFPTAGAHPITMCHVLLAVAAVGAGTVVALSRVPHALDTTWAEDAHIFLADAVAQPLWRNLVTPYSGYLHVLPRLIAELVALGLPSAAAASIAVAAALTTSLLALTVYVAAGPHLRSTAARLAVSAPMLLLPFATAEVPLSLATLRWQLMYVMFWALLWSPRTRAGRFTLVLLVALTVTSDNVVILFLPLALLRWWVRRDVLSAIIATMLIAATAVDIGIPFLGIDEHPTIAPRVSPLWALAAYVVRPLPQLLFGEASIGDRPGRDALGMAVTAAAWGCVAVAVWVAWRRRPPRRLLAALAAVYSVGIYTFVVMISGYALTRYAVPAALLMVTALVALLAPTSPPAPTVMPSRRQWWPLGVFLAGLSLVGALNFRAPNVRSDGPLWSAGLASATAACADGATDAQILVSPTVLGWAAEFPCGYLRS